MSLKPFGSSKPKLRSFGGTGGTKKLKAFGGKSKTQATIDNAVEAYEQALAEELRLFEIVDKYELRGKKDTPKYEEAKGEHDAAARRLDRAYSTLHNSLSRGKMMHG